MPRKNRRFQNKQNVIAGAYSRLRRTAPPFVPWPDAVCSECQRSFFPPRTDFGRGRPFFCSSCLAERMEWLRAQREAA